MGRGFPCMRVCWKGSVRVTGNDYLADPTLKRAYNRKLFAIVAPRYRLATGVLSFFQDRSWKKRLVGLLPEVAPGELLVDLACGTGEITRALAVACPQARVIGADITPAMIGIAARITGQKSLLLTIQDMSAMGVKSGAAAIVTGGYALRNAPELSAVISETARMLKKGGTAVFLDFTKSPRRRLARLQGLTLLWWGAMWGVLLHGKPSVYAYISRSLVAYPTRTELHVLFEKAGFTVQRSIITMFGFIEILLVKKKTA